MVPAKEQWSGCLIGQCLGDALGAPLEGQDPRSCAHYVTSVLRSGDPSAAAAAAAMMPPASSSGQHRLPSFPLGQYTDDSQLARELMLSYAACGAFDAPDYARRLGGLFRDNRVVGAGRATEEVGRRIADGMAFEQAAIPAPSAGNASAMRAAPIGLFYYDDPQGLIAAARDQSRVTHQDPRCAAGAVAIAGAVALALRQRPIVVESFLGQLAEWVRRIDEGVAFDVYQLSAWGSLSPEAAATFMIRAGLCPGQTSEWRGVSSYVVTSVLWSLYCFLRTPEDYLETIYTAIAAGGDVDTTAAMAGAVSGAHLGLSALPASWTGCLTDRGQWSLSDLIAVAERCYDRKHAASQA
jgi:ADP-ribosylglycohydrolase